MTPELVSDLLMELKATCVIIKNARAVMSEAQAEEWGRKNALDGTGKVVAGVLEKSRNTHRAETIVRAEKALRSHRPEVA
jgi:hypothetical protein